MYAMSAMTSLSSIPFGPPALTSFAATASACVRATRSALASYTASYGTFSIAIASTRDWMSLHAMSFSSKCG